MNILFITATYVPSTNGVAISIANQKQKLEKLGHTVTVLAPKNKPTSKDELRVFRFASIPNPFVRDYPIPLLLNIRILNKILDKIQPDIIHVHHPLSVGNTAVFAARVRHVPLVFTYHTRYEQYIQYFLHEPPMKYFSIFVKRFIDDFLNKPDVIISPSQSLTRSLLAEKPYLSIQTIPSFSTDIPKVSSTKFAIKKQLHIRSNQKLLLAVSRLSKEKNILLLIEALALLPSHFVLCLVGEGPYERNIKRLVHKLHLEQKVIFAGNIDHQHLGSYYQVADLFVHASVSETQGLIFQEAMSFNLPIVAVTSDSSKEWVSKQFGLLTKNNSIAFSKAILSLIDGKIVKKFSSTMNFNKQKLADDSTIKLVQTYKKLIVAKRISNELSKTGWQSWSTKSDSVIKLPLRNFSSQENCVGDINCNSIHRKKPARGWCSWYAFGADIDEQKIMHQTEWFARHRNVPIEYILIDDGWTRWGDWKSINDKCFPSGFSFLTKQIISFGFHPGVWIAPFLVDPQSRVAQTHPDWCVKHSNLFVSGLAVFPLDALFRGCYILDIRKKDVFTYINECIDLLLHQLKFQLIKLDFLYAIYFIPGMSEKEAQYYLRELFLYIKGKYPFAYTIACGCPLLAGVNAVDSMRIGPDIINPSFDNVFPLNKIYHHFTVNNVMRNVRSRMWTSKYWNLDADAFVCRPTLGISNKNIMALQRTIALTNGNIFLGDDMTMLDPNTIDSYIKPLFSKHRATLHKLI